MTANISIPIALADNVLTVPLSAVFTEGGERFVYIKKGDNWEQRTVKIGVADFSFVEIQDGLNEDEIVALEPPSMELVAESTNNQKGQFPGAPGAGGPGGGAGRGNRGPGR